MELQQIPLDQLTDSPTQPRRIRTHTKRGWQDFVDSIRQLGVLEPIRVRPVAGALQIVFGHQRKAGAQEAGLETIPAMVAEMSDEDVLDAQLVENMHREDLHPLDECDAFAVQLEHGRTAEEVSGRIGRSTSYVYKRLKLRELHPKAKELFLGDDIGESVALMIARIPDQAMQRQAAVWAASEKASVSAVRAHIHEKYMLSLAHAPFDPKDKRLVPDAGACTKCPHRTGNQRDLFDDVKARDLCTLPSCFESKKAALWARAQLEAQEAGDQILADADTRWWTTDDVPYTPGPEKLVNLDRKIPVSFLDALPEGSPAPDQTWAEATDGRDLSVVIARDDTGRVHRLAPETEAIAAAAANGHEWAKIEEAAEASGEREDLDLPAEELTADHWRVTQLYRKNLTELLKAKQLDAWVVLRVLLFDWICEDQPTEGLPDVMSKALGALWDEKNGPPEDRNDQVRKIVTGWNVELVQRAVAIMAVDGWYGDTLDFAGALAGLDTDRLRADALAELQEKQGK